MNGESGRFNHNTAGRTVYIIVGIAINVLMAFFTDVFNLPIYLDTIGTIGVSILGGLFPGILTAVVTNVLCMIFNHEALYFTIINVMIAVYTTWHIRKYSLRDVKWNFIFVMFTGLFSGIASSLIQWFVLLGPQNQSIADIVDTTVSIPKFSAFLLIMSILNLFDKGLSLAIALFILRFIPEKIRKLIRNSNWKQKPLTREELKSINSMIKDGGLSIRSRISFTLVGVSMAIVIIMVFISTQLYFRNVKEEKKEAAVKTAEFAAEIVDGDKIDDYIEKGRDVKGYTETENMLYKIRDNSNAVEYLYIIKIEDDGCYVSFDLDTEDVPAYEPGEKIEFEEAFLPYLPALFEGREIEPVESDDISGWVLTAYHPIKNKKGVTVSYAAADVKLEYTADYMKAFIIKVILLLSGFFALILAYGLWTTSTYIVYPVASITSCVSGFANESDTQEELDENVKKIRALGIQTGDEVEKLYRAISSMTLSQAEQMRDIRHYSDVTAKMQDGLIITMADMVENRDSDTGAHIQKTAAYVKIIVEGLRKKGYYPEKITDKYISDVVRSAPLHDVGKINISDKILNKPGKLTDEEYEIMKTHASAGKQIMENAISTVHGENYLKEARNMAAYHHERWDGKGYPEGLHGEVIPLSARIMAVADVFDALTSKRVYKPAFPLDKALEIIQEGAGTQFDAKCVEALMDNLTEVKVVLKKYNEDV